MLQDLTLCCRDERQLTKEKREDQRKAVLNATNAQIKSLHSRPLMNENGLIISGTVAIFRLYV